MKKNNVISKNMLVDYFRQGEKTSSSLLIGTEHEHFLFDGVIHKRLPYQGDRSIKAILQSLESDLWQPILENQMIIGLTNKKSKSSITLEPGGQIELSGAPLSTLHQTKEELFDYILRLDQILRSFDCYRLGLGFDPISKREDVDWMPKKRYDIMRDYMPTKGNLGLDMMLRTCTVQANLDYISEADMVAKFRVGMALQPFVSALFANSKIVEGRKTEFASYRCHIWHDTDPDRCGWLDFVFDEDFGYERYVDYLLSVPMYFVYRDRYINMAGKSFNDFMQAKLPNFEGEYPTLSDWSDHTTVAFPEVRLKRYLEMRGADCGSEQMILALPALWVGLLYDAHNLEKYHQLSKEWQRKDMRTLYGEVPKLGIKAIFADRKLQEWLLEIVTDALHGLKRRQNLNAIGEDESVYLNCLFNKLV